MSVGGEGGGASECESRCGGGRKRGKSSGLGGPVPLHPSLRALWLLLLLGHEDGFPFLLYPGNLNLRLKLLRCALILRDPPSHCVARVL